MTLELFKFRPEELSPRDGYMSSQSARFRQFKEDIGKDMSIFLKDIILPEENILEICLPLQAKIGNQTREDQFYIGYCLHPIIIDTFVNDEDRRTWRSALQQIKGLDLSLINENPLRLNEIVNFNYLRNIPVSIQQGISNYHALNLKEKLQLVRQAQHYAVSRLR